MQHAASNRILLPSKFMPSYYKILYFLDTGGSSLYPKLLKAAIRKIMVQDQTREIVYETIS
jgi:hypothetical protein